MTDIMMILGDFEFKIDTAAFQPLERRHRQNKAVLGRVGRKSASQHINILGTLGNPNVPSIFIFMIYSPHSEKWCPKIFGSMDYNAEVGSVNLICASSCPSF